MGVLFPKPYNIKRSSKGKFIKGRWVTDAKTIDVVYGDAQPMTSYTVSRLDIGDKGLGKITFYTDEVLSVSDKTSGISGDYVEFDSQYYELISEEIHVGIMPHKKYIGEFRKNESV